MFVALLYLFCFFPFVKFIPIGINLDTQPWALVWSCIYIVRKVICEKKIVVPRIFMYFVIFVLACVGLVAGMTPFLPQNELSNLNDSYTIIRNLLSVASMICITYASFLANKEKGIKEEYIKSIINIWFVVAFIQKFFISDFAYTIVANARTSANRGTVSLASEPAFYGYMCVFLFLFVYDFEKKKIFYLINLMVQIIFFAESSNTILLILCMLFFLIIKVISLMKREDVIKYISVGIGGGIVLYTIAKLIVTKMNSQRLGMFLGVILSNADISSKIERLLQDRSIAVRLLNIVRPIRVFIEDIGMPHGLSTVRDVSGFLGLTYQYGIFGVIMIVFLFYLMKQGYLKNEIGQAFSYSIVTIMIIGIQLTNPTIWFFVGYCMSRKYSKKIDYKDDLWMSITEKNSGDLISNEKRESSYFSYYTNL